MKRYFPHESAENRRPFGLDIGRRIAAFVDPPPRLPGLGAGGRRYPIAVATDGEAALIAAAGVVVRAGTAADADAEARDFVLRRYNKIARIQGLASDQHSLRHDAVAARAIK